MGFWPARIDTISQCRSCGGDWKWHVYLFNMRRSWRANKFCWRCEVDKLDPANNYLDLSDEPFWASTELSQVQFLSRIIGPSHVRPSRLFQSKLCTLHTHLQIIYIYTIVNVCVVDFLMMIHFNSQFCCTIWLCYNEVPCCYFQSFAIPI